MTKKVNAEEFNKKPGPVFRAADKGETVIINHDRYEKVFELTARDREPLKEQLVDIGNGCVTGEGVANYAQSRITTGTVEEVCREAFKGVWENKDSYTQKLSGVPYPMEIELVQISKDFYVGCYAPGFIKDNQDKFNKKGSDDE